MKTCPLIQKMTWCRKAWGQIVCIEFNLDNVDNMINVAAFCSLYSPQACWDQNIHGFDIVKHRRKSMVSHLQTLQGTLTNHRTVCKDLCNERVPAASPCTACGKHVAYPHQQQVEDATRKRQFTRDLHNLAASWCR